MPASRRPSMVLPSPAARRGAGCARRQRRSRERVSPAPGPARRRDPACPALRARRRPAGRRGRCSPRLGGRRRPRRGGALARHRCRRGPPRGRTRPRTATGSARPGARPRRPQSCRRPDAPCRRGRAPRRTRARAAVAGGSWCDPASTASAIGRSKPDPSFRNAAGARLTVMRLFHGQARCALTTPLWTRCFASWQARSASPTIANDGRSAVTRCASTSTRRGSRPTTA